MANSSIHLSATSLQKPVSRIISLAKQINAEAEKVDRYLKQQNLSYPGFGIDDPAEFPHLPTAVQNSRYEILRATNELNKLIKGPKESLRWTAWGFYDSLSLQVVNSYGLAKLVPLEGSISLKDLQANTTLDAVNLARIMRHAMVNYIFCEPSPGMIAHTASSRLLLEDEDFQAWVGFITEDMFPAAAHVLPALRMYPEATSPKHCGFNFAFNTVGKESMFATFDKDPVRAKRVARAMSTLAREEGYELSHFVDNYDLSDVNETRGILVDVGGSHGFICVGLAKRWANIKFIVQDLPKAIDSAPSPICSKESVAKRIQLQTHDFFKEQPIVGADVYYFRWILHNYSDPHAIQILKNLVPALKRGARVVINDHCLTPVGTENAWDEARIRSMDLGMLAILNAHERDAEQFCELFKAADEKFVFKGVTRTEGCRMGVFEAVWEP